MPDGKMMMNGKRIALGASSALLVLLLAACAGVPRPAARPVSDSTLVPTSRAPGPTIASGSDSTNTSESANWLNSPFETQSNEEGNVTVAVKPTALVVGQPMQFAIGMNTHSVNLGDDMTQITTLRDDSGHGYQPTGWEGPGPGGHHRSGTLKFPALTSKPKYVEMVIKGLAQVPERVFKWDLP